MKNAKAQMNILKVISIFLFFVFIRHSQCSRSTYHGRTNLTKIAIFNFEQSSCYNVLWEA